MKIINEIWHYYFERVPNFCIIIIILIIKFITVGDYFKGFRDMCPNKKKGCDSTMLDSFKINTYGCEKYNV